MRNSAALFRGANMGLPAEELRITRTLGIDEVHWPQVLELLQKRYKTPFREASAILDDFLKRFTDALHVAWFARPQLSSADNTLLSAVCECHGADSVILTMDRPYRAGPFRLQYSQAIQFTPALRVGAETAGLVSAPVVELRLFGRLHRIETLSQALFAYAVLGLSGILSYVFIVGALLYALSVFLLFLESPEGVTAEATDNPAVGLALLSFLVATAAIFGRAVGNLSRLLMQKLRRRAS